MSHIFGPVPSRRLGYSLGVDLVPPKVCTLDCIYCQVGRTTEKTVKRCEWVDSEMVCKQLDQWNFDKKKIDYITFSGSGEPTLNSAIGKIIKKIKTLCSIPVAVLTNATLLHRVSLREDLMGADLVVPSLDAVSPEIFKKVNQPHPDITVDMVIAGMEAFIRDFKGLVWLEVMLVKGVNDSPAELLKISNVVKSWNVDKIQINTLERPAPDSDVKAVAPETLELAVDMFGSKAETIGGFAKKSKSNAVDDNQDAIMELIKRRPCSIKQISQSLDMDSKVVLKYISTLMNYGIIENILHNNELYYRDIQS